MKQLHSTVHGVQHMAEALRQVTTLLCLRSGQQRDVRRQGGIEEHLAIEDLVRFDVDAHHKLEAKDGLLQRSPDCGVELLARATSSALPPVGLRLAAQPIERSLG